MIRIICFLILYIPTFSLKAGIDPREFDYTEIDSVMLHQKTETFENPEALTDFINKKYKKEHEKFRAVFVWVTANISFNCGDGNVNALEVFESRKAVSLGFSELIKLLCDECGLKGRIVKGLLKDDVRCLNGHIDSLYFWNIVSINGKEYFADANCSADNYDPDTNKSSTNFDDTYFLTNPSTFILNHFPDNPADQLLPYVIPKKTFIESPCFLLKAINYEITSYSPSTALLKVKENEIIFFNFEMTYTPAHMSIEIMKDLNDERPDQQDIIFTEEGNKINFSFQNNQSENFYLCIRFDERDAVYYKIIITE